MASKQAEVFDNLLKLQEGTQRTLFNSLKKSPRRPTIKKFHEFLDHFQWLMSFGNVMNCLDGIAKVKIEQFAEEANQLSADELGVLAGNRRNFRTIFGHHRSFRITQLLFNYK